jgi:3-hydroxyisobutyrate dehydrogenase
VRLAARVVTMLPATAHVEDVYLGPEGLMSGLGGVDTTSLADAVAASPWMLGGEPMPPGGLGEAHTLFVDSTTLDPVAAKRIAKTVRECTAGGALMVDCPVSGGGRVRGRANAGITGATAGTLTLMLGSDDAGAAALARALMQLTARGGGVVSCGGNGAGIGAKVCNK